MKNVNKVLKRFPETATLAWVFAVFFSLNASQSWGQTPTAYTMSSGNKTWDFTGTWTVSGSTYSGTDAGNWGSVGIIGTGTSVTTGVRTTKSSASIVTGTAGGFQKPSGTVQLLSTGSSATPEAVAIDLFLNFTGRTVGTLTYDWAAIDNSSGTRPTSLRVFWSIDGSTFTEITGAQQLDRESATSPATGTVSAVALPSAFNGSSTARLRFYNHAGSNATGGGNRDKFQIDNVAITSTAASFSVTFNGNGSTGGSMSNQTASTATALTSNAFTRTGYTFAGWNTVAGGGGTAYANNASYPFTANATLYAQWTANTLTATYDSQGGSAITSGSTTSGGSIASSPGTPTRAGYTFNGWFIASSGGTAISFPYTHGQTSNFTLFAQWTASGSPTLDAATLTVALSNVYGTASVGQSFTASGTFLSSNISVTAQSGFEISTSVGSGYGASVSVTSGTSVWVRFAALQNAGTFNGTVAAVLSSTGATPVNVLTSVSGNTVSPKPLSITASTIASKDYDATATAGAVTVGTLSGFVGIQTVSATGAASNYSSANAGTYNSVSIAYSLANGSNGGLAANYSLVNGSATGIINPKELSISTPTIASKVYDASNLAGTLSIGTLSGLVGSETLSISGSASNYSSANVGSYSSTITYTLGNGSGLAANYSLATGSATGAITPQPLSISAPSLSSKVYDATTAPGIVTAGTLSGLIGGQTLSVSGSASNYGSANVGSYSSSITYTLGNGSGLASNYSLATGTAFGSITPKLLSITAPSIASKAYNASTTAGAVTAGTLSGFVGIETVSATGTAAAYSSANVGSYTNVVVNYTLANGSNGGLAINYSLAAGTATGVITQQALSITATDATKEVAQLLTGGAGSTAFTSLGLQGGQTIGSVTITYGGAAGNTGQGATLGTYAGQATPSAATGGTFNAANYSITYVAGAIIVTNPNAMMLTTFGSAVCENFSDLATSGTSSTMPSGWAFSETGTNANTTYASGTGSSATGETYSFGTAADRTLGGLRSGSLIPSYGTRIFNNTGSTISTITIAYTGKTWRVGAASRPDQIDFQYSSNATSLTTGTWIDENNLDYANPGQATGNGSVLHSANISHTMQGLSLAPGASIWIRWTDLDATGADDGMGVDDVCITPIVPCTAPDLLVFNAQPSNVLQDATMSTVTVRAYCSSTGLTATGYTGNITLSASGGGCGYVSQTVAAVNGIATFSSIVFTRSAQTGITLTAAASGFSNLLSNTFNVTTPAGSVTTVAQQDFGSNTSLSYSTAVGGLGVFNTSNTRGVSSSNCLAFYYNDCLTGASGSSSTATFSQSSGLSSLTNIKLNFSIAWGGSQLAGANCDGSGFGGSGLDNDDFIRLETRVNGGAFTSTFQLNGNSNKQYNFSASGISINHNANQTISSSTEPSAFTINLPAGTTSVEFRFTFKTNRRSEIIYLDNLSLLGNAAGTPLPLPSANAGLSFSGCNGGPNQLQGSATQTIGSVSYSWSPSATLNNANTSNPQASNTATTTYTLSITDADNCAASSTVTVSVLSGIAGLWTGTENSDWFNCQNWASGNIPASSTDVVISGTGSIPEISSGTATCRNLTINAGGVLNMSGSATKLEITGNLVNNGTFAPAGTVAFTGTTAQSFSGLSLAQNLTINNAAGVSIQNNITVSGLIWIQSGNLQLQTYKLTMAATASISETTTSQILGEIETTRNLGLSNETFGGLGIEIDADGDVPGVTVVKRFTGTPVTSVTGAEGIKLKYSIVPANNNNLDATLIFRYKDSDLNGQDENNFQLYRSVDGGLEWSEELAIADPDNNMLTKTGISSFSEWTAADANIPLPVVLQDFYGRATGRGVADLFWSTASEQDNAGFRLYKSRDGQKFEVLDFVRGSGNSSTGKAYRILDAHFTESSYYKLVQVDKDGSELSGKIIFLKCNCEQALKVMVYPNPASGNVHFSANENVSEDEVFQLEIIGLDGRALYQNHTGLKRLESLLNDRLRNLPSGLYHLRLFNARMQEDIKLQWY